jgi:hypothetical protein
MLIIELSSGVLLTTTALITDMCQQNSQALENFRKVRLSTCYFH